MSRIYAVVFLAFALSLAFSQTALAQTQPNTAGSTNNACTAGDYKCAYGKNTDGSLKKDADGEVCMQNKPCSESCQTADDVAGTIQGACVSQNKCGAETTCNGQKPQQVTTQQIQNALTGTPANQSTPSDTGAIGNPAGDYVPGTSIPSVPTATGEGATPSPGNSVGASALEQLLNPIPIAQNPNLLQPTSPNADQIPTVPTLSGGTVEGIPSAVPPVNTLEGIPSSAQPTTQLTQPYSVDSFGNPTYSGTTPVSCGFSCTVSSAWSSVTGTFTDTMTAIGNDFTPATPTQPPAIDQIAVDQQLNQIGAQNTLAGAQTTLSDSINALNSAADDKDQAEIAFESAQPAALAKMDSLGGVQTYGPGLPTTTSFPDQASLNAWNSSTEKTNFDSASSAYTEAITNYNQALTSTQQAQTAYDQAFNSSLTTAGTNTANWGTLGTSLNNQLTTDQTSLAFLQGQLAQPGGGCTGNDICLPVTQDDVDQMAARVAADQANIDAYKAFAQGQTPALPDNLTQALAQGNTPQGTIDSALRSTGTYLNTIAQQMWPSASGAANSNLGQVLYWAQSPIAVASSVVTSTIAAVPNGIASLGETLSQTFAPGSQTSFQADPSQAINCAITGCGEQRVIEIGNGVASAFAVTDIARLGVSAVGDFAGDFGTGGIAAEVPVAPVVAPEVAPTIQTSVAFEYNPVTGAEDLAPSIEEAPPTVPAEAPETTEPPATTETASVAEPTSQPTLTDEQQAAIQNYLNVQTRADQNAANEAIGEQIGNPGEETITIPYSNATPEVLAAEQRLAEAGIEDLPNNQFMVQETGETFNANVTAPETSYPRAPTSQTPEPVTVSISDANQAAIDTLPAGSQATAEAAVSDYENWVSRNLADNASRDINVKIIEQTDSAYTARLEDVGLTPTGEGSGVRLMTQDEIAAAQTQPTPTYSYTSLDEALAHSSPLSFSNIVSNLFGEVVSPGGLLNGIGESISAVFNPASWSVNGATRAFGTALQLSSFDPTIAAANSLVDSAINDVPAIAQAFKYSGELEARFTFTPASETEAPVTTAETVSPTPETTVTPSTPAGATVPVVAVAPTAVNPAVTSVSPSAPTEPASGPSTVAANAGSPAAENAPTTVSTQPTSPAQATTPANPSQPSATAPSTASTPTPASTAGPQLLSAIGNAMLDALNYVNPITPAEANPIPLAQASAQIDTAVAEMNAQVAIGDANRNNQQGLDALKSALVAGAQIEQAAAKIASSPQVSPANQANLQNLITQARQARVNVEAVINQWDVSHFSDGTSPIAIKRMKAVLPTAAPAALKAAQTLADAAKSVASNPSPQAVPVTQPTPQPPTASFQQLGRPTIVATVPGVASEITSPSTPGAQPAPVAHPAPQTTVPATAHVDITSPSAVAPGGGFKAIGNISNPATAKVVTFYYGNGGSITDALTRQNVAQQVVNSCGNCVVVIPDIGTTPGAGTAGALATPAGAQKFDAEVNAALSRATNVPTSAIAAMPRVVIAYSGGFAPANAALQGIGSEVTAYLGLDDLYGNTLDAVNTWAQANPNATAVLECSTTCTANAQVNQNPSNFGKGVTIVNTGVQHVNFVSANNPIQNFIASVGPAGTAVAANPAAAIPGLKLVPQGTTASAATAVFSIKGPGVVPATYQVNAGVPVSAIQSLVQYQGALSALVQKGIATPSQTLQHFAARPLPQTGPQKPSPAQLAQAVEDADFQSYQAAPHVDSTGPFGWKDAQTIGSDSNCTTLECQVIGGMTPDLQARLYTLIQMAKTQGINIGINSGYRSNARQALITSGYHAPVGGSNHGGTRVGGYENGDAADLVGVNGTSNLAAWNFIDQHSQDVGLARVIGPADPSHVQPVGPTPSAVTTTLNNIVVNAQVWGVYDASGKLLASFVPPATTLADTGPAIIADNLNSNPALSALKGDGSLNIAPDNSIYRTNADGSQTLVAKANPVTSYYQSVVDQNPTAGLTRQADGTFTDASGNQLRFQMTGVVIPTIAANPGNINSPTDRAAVAQQAYTILKGMGIQPADLALGSPNYGKAWATTIEVTRSVLASRNMLNPGLTLGSVIGVARQETGIPGNMQEFQSSTGVRGLLQVTGDSARTILGSDSTFNTFPGSLGSVPFAREDNMGSVITGMLEFNNDLYAQGGNIVNAAQTFNSGSPTSCIGGGCASGPQSYGKAVSQDAAVIGTIKASCNGETTCIVQQLRGLAGNRSTGASALQDITAIVSTTIANPAGGGNGSGGGGGGGGGGAGAGGSGAGGVLLPPDVPPTDGINYQPVLVDQNGNIIGKVGAATIFSGAAATLYIYSVDEHGNPDNEIETTVPTQSENGTKDIALLVDQNGNLVLGKDGNPIPIDPTTVPKPTWDPNTNTYTIDTTPPAAAPNPWAHQQSGNPYAGNQQPQQSGQIQQFPQQRPAQQQPPYQTPAQPIAQPLPQPILPPTSNTPTSGSAVVTIVANPSNVASSSTSRIVWSSVGTVSCQVGPQTGALIGTSTNGTALSAPLATSTVFIASCVTQTQTQVFATTTVTVH